MPWPAATRTSSADSTGVPGGSDADPAEAVPEAPAERALVVVAGRDAHRRGVETHEQEAAAHGRQVGQGLDVPARRSHA